MDQRYPQAEHQYEEPEEAEGRRLHKIDSDCSSGEGHVQLLGTDVVIQYMEAFENNQEEIQALTNLIIDIAR